MARSVATSAPRCPALLSRPPLPLIIGALFALLLLGLFLSSPPTPSLPTSVPARDRLANFHPVSEVRWAIIGCGDVTEKKSGPALAVIPSSRLVAVMRRNATLAQDYAQRHHVPRCAMLKTFQSLPRCAMLKRFCPGEPCSRDFKNCPGEPCSRDFNNCPGGGIRVLTCSPVGG
ncbi:unnamed protein product [Closterium sp. NIES-53]